MSSRSLAFWEQFFAEAESRVRNWAASEPELSLDELDHDVGSTGPLADQAFRDSLLQSLQQVSEEYYRAPSNLERLKLRDLFQDKPFIADAMTSFAELLATNVTSRDREGQLRAGLAMLSLNDQRSDSREFLLALHALVDAAEVVGIDAVKLLDEFARLSNPEVGSFERSTSDVFADYRDARRR